MKQKKSDDTSKGKGFKQPLKPHKNWHTDISYVKIQHRFYFFICVLDGYSRFIVHWDLGENMKENDVAIDQQTALEKISGVHPRYITDNGKQFTGKESQYFIALHGLTHVRTSPYYPQSNGKVERFHGTIKKERIRKKALLDQGHAKIIIGAYIAFYNNQQLHSANAYILPDDQLAGRDNKIHEERRKKIHAARLKRKHNVLRDEIKLNKLEYKLTSQKLYSYLL
jgi:putative transposase